MKRNLFTKEEIILCTFIARFGRINFDEDDIQRIEDRSVWSIKMKVQNIAAMLNEEGYETDYSVSKLSGKTTGEKGRRTNWEIVRTLVDDSRNELLNKCQKILSF